MGEKEEEVAEMNKQKLKFLGLVVMLPTIFGCGGGGGTGALFALLFGNSASGLLGFGGGGSVIPPAGVMEVARLTNPEPATMLLVGGGMAAMAFFKAKNKQ